MNTISKTVQNRLRLLFGHLNTLVAMMGILILTTICMIQTLVTTTTATTTLAADADAVTTTSCAACQYVSGHATSSDSDVTCNVPPTGVLTYGEFFLGFNGIKNFVNF